MPPARRASRSATRRPSTYRPGRSTSPAANVFSSGSLTRRQPSPSWGECCDPVDDSRSSTPTGGSLRLDVGADDLADAVRRTMCVERARPSRIGRRLADLARAAGFRTIVSTHATQVWSSWDPDSSPAPDGCFSMRDLAEDVIDAGELEAIELDRFVTTAHDAARQGRFT